MAWLVSLVLASASGDVVVSHRKVVTSDGVALAVYRYQRPDVASALPPVVLVPDLGFSRAVFDLGGRGLARWLSSQGRVVFVVELRGQGKADPGLRLEPMATVDFPAVLAALKLEQVDLVVQGWVGSLLLGVHGTDGRVRRVVALNTPLEAGPPSRLAEHFLSDGARFSALASGPAGQQVFHHLFALWAELPSGVERAVLSNGTRDLSAPVAAEWLAWMRSGDLPIGRSSVSQGLSRLDRPTLLLLGLADGIAPPEQCAVLRERARGPVEVHAFSRAEGAEDFSHLSILLGRFAERRIFPRISAFLGAAP